MMDLGSPYRNLSMYYFLISFVFFPSNIFILMYLIFYLFPELVYTYLLHVIKVFLPKYSDSFVLSFIF